MFKWLFSFFILLIVCTINIRAETVRTKLSNGSPVNGYVITRAQRRVHAYRSIPYARKPIGDLRFKKPQTNLDRWEDPLEAIASHPVCPSGKTTLDGHEADEDCLYMDLFFDEPCTKVICPVSIFIEEAIYREDKYTIIHNITDPELMIFFNYRFGCFGFLDFGADSDETPLNVGLHDMLEALKWVKREASSFHGDPKRITIFSFGDVSSTMLQYLLSSPSSKDAPLSRLALIDSRPLMRSRSNRNLTMELLRNLNCLDDHRLTTAQDQMKCLRTRSTNEILRNTPDLYAFLPQTDSTLLSNADSYAELAKKNWIKSTIYLISHKDAPFSSDHHKSIHQLCHDYSVHMFGYKSPNVHDACVQRYIRFNDGNQVIGRHAVHALNAWIGALNKQSEGQTFSAIFAQPGVLTPNLEYQFLNERIGDNDTPSQHKLHMLYMESRENFAHLGLAPIEGFIPVNSKGQNYLWMEYQIAEDGVTVVKEPKMHIDEWFNAEATLFWLSELANIERSALRSRLNNAAPNKSYTGGSIFFIVLIVTFLMAFLVVLRSHKTDLIERQELDEYPSYSSI